MKETEGKSDNIVAVAAAKADAAFATLESKSEKVSTHCMGAVEEEEEEEESDEEMDMNAIAVATAKAAAEAFAVLPK